MVGTGWDVAVGAKPSQSAGAPAQKSDLVCVYEGPDARRVHQGYQS